MGRGSGLCSKVGGRENPAIAAWALAAALTASISMTCFLLAEATQLKDTTGKGLDPEEYGEVMFVSRGTFIGLGCLHAILFLLSCIITILGYFFWSKCLCFACPLVIIGDIACLITSSFGGYMLHSVYTHRIQQIDIARVGGLSPTIDFSLSFVDAHASLILFISVASLACLCPLSRAGTIDEKGSMVDVMLHLPALTGCITMGGMFIFPTREGFYIAAGIVWFLLAAIAAALITFQKYKGLASRIFTIFLAVLYCLILAVSVISVAVAGKHFLGGRKQVVEYVRTNALFKPTFLKDMTEDNYFLYKNYIIQNEGGFNLAAIVIGSIIFIYSFFAVLFSLRAVIGGADALRRDISSSSSDKE